MADYTQNLNVPFADEAACGDSSIESGDRHRVSASRWRRLPASATTVRRSARLGPRPRPSSSGRQRQRKHHLELVGRPAGDLLDTLLRYRQRSTTCVTSWPATEEISILYASERLGMTTSTSPASRPRPSPESSPARPTAVGDDDRRDRPGWADLGRVRLRHGSLGPVHGEHRGSPAGLLGLDPQHVAAGVDGRRLRWRLELPVRRAALAAAGGPGLARGSQQRGHG